ncbi:hypothetical protein JCM11251_000795 [Rhodosporidiobolus azoricus]
MDIDEGSEEGPGPPASVVANATVVSASDPDTSSHGIDHAPDVTSDTTSNLASGLPPLSSEAVAPSSPSKYASSTSPRLPHLAEILLNASTIHPFNPDDADLSSTVPPSTSSGGPLASGVPNPTSPAQGPTLRQLALYQALAARGQQLPSSTFPSFPSFPSPFPAHSTFDPNSFSPFHLPHAPPPTPTLPLHPTSSSALGYPLNLESNLSTDGVMPPTSHKWQTSLEGLNVVADPSPWSTSNGRSGIRSGAAGVFSNVSADELLAAQASLDLWASTSFSSPGLSAGMTMASTSAPLPPSHLPSLPAISAAAEHASGPPSSLDWSALYPNGSPFSPPSGGGASASLPLSSISSLGLSHHASSAGHPSTLPHPFASPHSVNLHGSQFSNLFDHSSASPHLTANGAVAAEPFSPQRSPPSTSHGARPTPSRRSSRANAGAKGKAARASFAVDEEGDEESAGEMSGGSGSASAEGGGGVGFTASGKKVPRDLMTAEEIEEDKRRRNTEASARFRAKKKMRDRELQQTSAQLREKVANLEREKESLTNENRWLRDIVSEKAEVQPHLLDVLRRSSVSEG